MSLILLWENPQICYDARCRAAQVWRGPAGSGVLLEPDATWGVYEEPTESDINAPLNIAYVDKDGGIIETIDNSDLRKFAKPTNVCKVLFDLTSLDGGPDDGRVITVSDPRDHSMSRRILTNRAGKAIFFGLRARRFLIHVDGASKALDCVLPNENEASWTSLAAFGSWVYADMRSRV